MSLRGDKYETAEEIKFRLEGTVVLYEKRPVYITRVQPAGRDDYGNPDGVDDQKEIARVFFYELPIGNNAKQVRKYLSSRNFDLTPFKMGYANYNGEALFISRNPVRQNRQGLSAGTTAIQDILGKPTRNVAFDNLCRSSVFPDMVNGNYPTFQKVGDLIDDRNQSSVAISRSFAFLIDHDLDTLVLMNKGTRCGMAIKGEKAIRIPQKFHFLREELEECRVPIA